MLTAFSNIYSRFFGRKLSFLSCFTDSLADHLPTGLVTQTDKKVQLSRRKKYVLAFTLGIPLKFK